MSDPITSAISDLTVRLRKDFDDAVAKYRELYILQENLLRESLPLIFQLTGNNPNKVVLMEMWVDRDEWQDIDILRSELGLSPLLDVEEEEEALLKDVTDNAGVNTDAPVIKSKRGKRLKPVKTIAQLSQETEIVE